MAASSRKLVVCSLGIFVCYFYFGILQEKITRSTYGENEKFTSSLSLVFVQCVVNILFAKLMMLTFMREQEDHTKQSYYGMCAFSYLSAMVSSNMALQHVNYPTQVIGKSCKPIPVMLLGVLIAKKRYSLAKYCFVLMIVAGVCLFIYKDKPAVAVEGESESMLGMGEILLLVSLALDGFTGAIQDKMRKEHQLQSGHLMFYLNSWASFFLGIAILITGEMWQFLAFVQKYNYVIYNILQFSIMGSLGQLFILLTVTDFGPLPCSIITTTRKFFTVLASVIFFGNTLIPRQWIAVGLVFTGLTLDTFYGKKGGDKKTEEIKDDKTQ